MQDIIEIFKGRKFSKMSQDELTEVVQCLRDFRLRKLTKAGTKKQTILDKVLKMLDVEKSHIILQNKQDKNDSSK